MRIFIDKFNSWNLKLHYFLSLLFYYRNSSPTSIKHNEKLSIIYNKSECYDNIYDEMKYSSITVVKDTIVSNKTYYAEEEWWYYENGVF